MQVHSKSMSLASLAPLAALLLGVWGASRIEVRTGPTVSGLAQISSIVSIAALTQAGPVSGEAVQAEIDAALAAGQPTYTLPATTINLTQSLAIPPGARNFTLQGQTGTRLVRAATSDFPLIRIGKGYIYSYLNSTMGSLPQTSLAPAAAGASTLTRTGGAEVVPGWYAIIGTNESTDTVTHYLGTPTFWFKRELIRVLSTNGNQITIDRPLGRAFETCELRQLQIPGQPSYNDQVVENISIKNLNLNGRSSVDGSLATKLLSANCFSGLIIENVSTEEFQTSSLSIHFGNGALLKNLLIGNPSTYQAAYGIEFMATRFTTVLNSRFRNHRWGVLYGSGAQDALVQDCTYDESPNGGFDTGHGQGEMRITYRRCIAPLFSIANPGWRRGTTNVTLENCTATSQINIYGADNVRISGKYPSASITTPIFCFFSEGGGSGLPTGNHHPKRIVLENGVSRRSIEDGVNIRTGSQSGITASIGDLTVRNWTFVNTLNDRGVNVQFKNLGAATKAKFEDCYFESSYLYGANFWVGDMVPTGSLDLTLTNCQFNVPSTTGVRFTTGSKGTLAHSANQFNNGPMSESRFENLATFLNNMQGGG